MGLQDLGRDINKFYKNAESHGKAVRVKVQGRSVCVNGRFYPVETAVPMTFFDGDYVYVHISGNRAVVIGG